MKDNVKLNTIKSLLISVKNAFNNLKSDYKKNCDCSRLITAFLNTLKTELGEYKIVYDFVCGHTPNVIEGETKDYILKSGDTVILDASVFYKGVWCDITRTFFVESISPEQIKQFDLIKESIVAGEKFLKTGKTADDIYNAVNGVIKNCGEDLVHHAGHKIDDTPVSSPEFVFGDKTEISSGFYAIESGIYKDFGIRLENNYSVENEKTENLFESLMPLDIKEYLLK